MITVIFKKNKKSTSYKIQGYRIKYLTTASFFLNTLLTVLKGNLIYIRINLPWLTTIWLNNSLEIPSNVYQSIVIRDKTLYCTKNKYLIWLKKDIK